MHISGIRPSVGFYDYKDINKLHKAETLNATPVEQVDQQEVQTSQQSKLEASEKQERSKEVEARQTFGTYDYAQLYNANATYSMKGEQSDLRSLDVQKAISDMQKDQLIRQYQYFVGGNQGNDVNVTSSVRGLEDFSL